MSARAIIDISIDPEFHPFIPAALLRLRYIYPALKFRSTDAGVTVEGASETDPVRLKREVAYQVYREKIFQDTLPLRQSLYEMLAR
ncbi:hypothetical protein [Gemmobacter sp.]|uniref:hypothetical protein n=1 Tax=Gemmobacter sp. TaxID=1898957 RepID=UPI002AFFDBB8|nr:hypothetical protein [Gemmobacter sp.]